MLKFITQPTKIYNGATYKARKIIADEKLLERLVKVPEALVYSSWRSLAEQKVLVAEGKSKTLYSNHRRGMAVDCINWKDVQDKMKKVGLINDISWDLNHFAFDGESKASKYPLYDALPKVLEEYKPKPKIDPTQPVIEPEVQVPTPTPNVPPSVPETPITRTEIEKAIEGLKNNPTKPTGVIYNPLDTIKLDQLSPIPELKWWQEIILFITNYLKK